MQMYPKLLSKFFTLVIVVFAFLSFGMSKPTSKGVLLSGYPKLPIGTVVREDASFIGQDLKAIYTVGYKTLIGKISMAISSREHIIPMSYAKSGQIKSYLKSYLKFKESFSQQLLGNKSNRSKSSPLVGESLKFSFSGGEWKKQLLGNSFPSTELTKAIKKENGFFDDRFLYPSKAVKVGHSWKVDASKLIHWFGNDLLSLKGVADFTLTNIEVHGTEKIAYMRVSVRFSGKQLDDSNNELKVNFGLTGVLSRSLTYGIDRSFKLEGVMKQEGDIFIEGKSVNVVMRGRVSFKGKSTILQ